MSTDMQSSADLRSKKKQKVRKGCLWLLVLCFGLMSLPWLWRTAVKLAYSRQIYTVETAPPKRVAVVFGAAVYGDRLSAVLRDRVETAVSLYEAGLVEKIIMSGDNQTLQYDEPSAMVAYAIEQGVPPEAVQPDYGGRRTYDTCYRAQHIFQAEEVILVTQAFHLPRALFTCQMLGLESIGVAADKRPYRGARWYELRETGATLMALRDVVLQAPPPVLGEPIPLNLN
jgi:SanA protein